MNREELRTHGDPRRGTAMRAQSCAAWSWLRSTPNFLSTRRHRIRAGILLKRDPADTAVAE